MPCRRMLGRGFLTVRVVRRLGNALPGDVGNKKYFDRLNILLSVCEVYKYSFCSPGFILPWHIHCKSDMEAIEEMTSRIKSFSVDSCPRGNQGYKRVLLQLFGFMGHGKSSFINTCKYVLEDGEYRNHIRSDKEGDGGARTVSRISYPLTDTLILVDNRGCPTMNDYETGEIFAQLANLLPLDEAVEWSRGFRLQERIVEAEKTVQPSDFIFPIFVFSVKNGLNGEMIPDIKKLLEFARDLTEIFPVVVLTHKTHCDFLDVKTKFKNMGAEQIFALENFTQEDQLKTRGRHENVLKFFCEVLTEIQFRMERMGDPVALREKRKIRVLKFLYDREIQIKEMEMQMKVRELEEKQRVRVNSVRNREKSDNKEGICTLN
ncbi:hypothetical protein XENTR_v10023452 [Xenopus tropicalis]|nr:hypothetical protein XENTR_v10023452 [Xenopus tropicalis]